MCCCDCGGSSESDGWVKEVDEGERMLLYWPQGATSSVSVTAHSAQRPVGRAIPARARARPQLQHHISQTDLQPARHCPSLPVHSARPNSCTSACSPRFGGRADCCGDGPAEMKPSPAHSRPQAPLHAGTRWRLTGIPHLRTCHSHVHNHRHNHFLLSSLIPLQQRQR